MGTTPLDCRDDRVQRLDRALEAQKAYIARVPDPDNRARAEANLSTLVGMREAAESGEMHSHG